MPMQSLNGICIVKNMAWVNAKRTSGEGEAVDPKPPGNLYRPPKEDIGDYANWFPPLGGFNLWQKQLDGAGKAGGWTKEGNNLS